MPVSTDHIVRSSLPDFEIPNLFMNQFVSNYLEQIGKSEPDRVALINAHTGAKLRFSDLNRNARQIATALQEHEVDFTPEDSCMFFAENSLDYAEVLFGAVLLGLPVIPIAPSYGPYELNQQLSGTGARILFMGQTKLPTLKRAMNNPNFADLIRQLKFLLIMERDVDDAVVEELKSHPFAPKVILTIDQLLVEGKEVREFCVPLLPTSPAKRTFMIMYTSGSTGAPKGIIHSHRTFLATIAACYDLKAPLDNAIQNLNFPLGHMSGFFTLLGALSMGITQVVFSKPVDTSATLAAVEKYRINRLLLSVTLSVDMLKNDYTGRFDLSSLQIMSIGGWKVPEFLARGLMAKYSVAFFEGYGSTEFIGAVRHAEFHYEPGNTGTVNASCELKIIDLESGEPLPAGQSGELCVRGPQCFVGYVDNVAASRKAIDEEGWYHTGDIGLLDEKGAFFMLDRLNELIKYKYFSVAAAEVESFLATHDAIKEVCVVGVKHATEGYHARAYVQLMEGRTATEQEIVQFAKDNIGYHNWLNGGVSFVSEMPHITLGKSDRQFFKRLVEGELLTEKAAPYEG